MKAVFFTFRPNLIKSWQACLVSFECKNEFLFSGLLSLKIILKILLLCFLNNLQSTIAHKYTTSIWINTETHRAHNDGSTFMIGSLFPIS